MTETSKRNVLFVDDSPSDADLYADYFDRDPRIRPITALSAEEGLTTLAQSDIDCIVSDSVQTNNGDPMVAVAKQIYPDVPVLLHSGRSADKLPTEIVDDFLQKGTKSDSSTALETLGKRVRELALEKNQPTTSTRNGSRRQWNSLGSFDWTTEDSLTVEVIGALAEQTGSDPLDLGPLYESIDPDALTVLMTHAAADERETTVQVQFEISGFTVRVRSDGTVEYREASD